MAATTEEDTSLADEGAQNVEAARKYSAGRSQVPYFVIGGVGVLLLLLILLRMIKVIKN